MPLTKDFRETLQARIQRDAKFRTALLCEAVNALLSDDLETGRAVLRDYINATLGFAALAEQTGLPEKSLMRMFGPNGNPRARNLLSVVAALQRDAGLKLNVAKAA